MLFFKTKRKVLLENAHNIARLAHKVISYRKDILSPAVVSEIEALQQELLSLCKDKASTNEVIEEKMEGLHKVIDKHGGDIYPLTFRSEHVEMLLVAAILAIGIRTFFFQPFKIPTNSMYPTYAGMTYELYTSPEEAPSIPEKLFRKIKLFTTNKHLKAKNAGELSVLVKRNKLNNAIMGIHNYAVPSMKFFVWPSQSRRVVFLVDGEPHPLDVPLEFQQILEIIRQEYPGELTRSANGKPIQLTSEERRAQGVQSYEEVIAIPLNKTLEENETILNMDILTGDMLFVDRISYHFRRPKVGEPFVFRTEKIKGLYDYKGQPDEKYYIKRLVGTEGDVLAVDEPVLISNGKPIEGAQAFQLNAERIGEYRGYEAKGWLRKGKTETIPAGYFYAMGDNSYHSHDSRGWAFEHPHPQTFKDSHDQKRAFGKPVNFVPQKEVVGKAVFIFYPFSNRWGPAQ